MIAISNSTSAPDLLVTYKPFGIKSHRSSPTDWGWVEWLEEQRNEKLYLFQRLDSGTSGLMLIARNEDAAKKWSELFKAKVIHKTYLFITDKKLNKAQTKQGSISESSKSHSDLFVVRTHIVKERGLWISITDREPNSETSFNLLRTEGAYQLWQAHPKTGKAHQIRLHAQSLGLSILGDPEHGGSPFFRLCLHAQRLEAPSPNASEPQTWTVSPPPYFDDLSLLQNPDLCALLDANHQRQQLQAMGCITSESYRLAHSECPSLRIDRFGSQLWVYNYQNPNSEATLAAFLPQLGNPPTFVREMKNRGQQPNDSLLLELNSPRKRWTAREDSIVYELRADQGLSPGLFLDQRHNRSWVRRHSLNQRVLNLFSYTCGFSLCAAIGGAKEVVSVDVSTAFLNWGKVNFEYNQLNPANFEFWSADVLEFLKRTAKKGRRFDLVICDPPSFGRSKSGVFKIDKNLAPLVKAIDEVLESDGLLLLSSNYEKWSLAEFATAALEDTPKGSYRQLEPPLPGLDYLEEDPILKTLLLKKQLSSD